MSDKRSVATDALETLGTIIDSSQKRDAIHLAVEPVTAGTILYPGQRIGLMEVDDLIDDSLKKGMAVPRSGAKVLGIVDPFLDGPVYPGQNFWLVVLPRKITSLRHVWSHPAFPESDVPVETLQKLAKLIQPPIFEPEAPDEMRPFYEGLVFEANTSIPKPTINLHNAVAEDEIEEDDESFRGEYSVDTAREWLEEYASGIGLDFSELISATEDWISHREYLNKGELLEGEWIPDEFWNYYASYVERKIDENDRGSFFSCSC